MAEEKKSSKKEPQEKKSASINGKIEELIALEYKKDNHHILHHVHGLNKGVNLVPMSAWEAAKDHPTTQQLVKDGHLVVVKSEEA